MTSPTLLSLAARVEQLTGPCRETDGLIYRSIDPVIENCWKFWSPAQLETIVPRYTASLDAAMTLVPEGLPILIRDGYDDAPGDKRPYAHVMNEIGEGYAATKALAIVVAALRARAALEVSRG